MARIRALALMALLVIWQQVAAQSGENSLIIPTGQNTYEVAAGDPLIVEWTNPSSGTVTIKLQQEPITLDGGIVLTTGIPASALMATLVIPTTKDLNSSPYVLEIIDDTDANNRNFSPQFYIDLATGSTSSAEISVMPTTIETSPTTTTTSIYENGGPDDTGSEGLEIPSNSDEMSSPESTGGGSRLTTPAIVGIAIGAVAVFLILVVVVPYTHRLDKRDAKLWDMATSNMVEFLSATTTATQDRFGGDREGLGQDTLHTQKGGVPVTYTLDHVWASKMRELVEEMRRV